MRNAAVAHMLAVVVLSPAVSAQPTPVYHVEQEPVPGAGEVLTIIRHQPGIPDTPLLSVLRDSLGDDVAENDRLRYLWILTSLPSTPFQRLLAALPFAHVRSGAKQHIQGVPKPLMDLAAPSKKVWSGLFEKAVQIEGLDGLGPVVRSTTRSYQGKQEEYRDLQVFHALAALEGLLNEGNDSRLLSRDELREIYSRLSLSTRTFGGLMQNESLHRYYEIQIYRAETTREHNWELLRQTAELSGLYFEPIPSPDGTCREALLWIARRDLHTGLREHFDQRFLKIGNPWTDHRLSGWDGYSTVRYFDRAGGRVDAQAPDAIPMELIPLALYSLDYPRVPLLLIDFRDSLNPTVREFAAQDAETLLGGILGVTRFSNWPALAVTSLFGFVRARHGATSVRKSRLQAYAQAYENLGMNSTLDSSLKIELLRRMEQHRLDVLEDATAELAGAREQYRLLRQYASSPNGLTMKLTMDREKEAANYGHSAASGALRTLGRLLTGKSEIDRAANPIVAQLDSLRRAQYHLRVLNGVLASRALPEASVDARNICESVEALQTATDTARSATRVIAAILKRTQDEEVRLACIRALATLNREPSRARAALDDLTDSPRTSGIVRRDLKPLR